MINIELKGRDDALRSVQRAVAAINDQNQVWDGVIDNVIIPKFEEVFQTDGYGQWAPRQDNLLHPLLRKTLNLYNSLTQQNAPGNVSIQSAHSLEFGTEVEYADYHEFGTSRIPARPVIESAIDNGLEGEVLQEIESWFQSKFGGF